MKLQEGIFQSLVAIKDDFFAPIPNPNYAHYSWVVGTTLAMELGKLAIYQYDLEDHPYLCGLPVSVLEDMKDNTIGIIKVWELKELTK